MDAAISDVKERSNPFILFIGSTCHLIVECDSFCKVNIFEIHLKPSFLIQNNIKYIYVLNHTSHFFIFFILYHSSHRWKGAWKLPFCSWQHIFYSTSGTQ